MLCIQQNFICFAATISVLSNFPMQNVELGVRYAVSKMLKSQLTNELYQKVNDLESNIE